jgi:hypothetical protein
LAGASEWLWQLILAEAKANFGFGTLARSRAPVQDRAVKFAIHPSVRSAACYVAVAAIALGLAGCNSDWMSARDRSEISNTAPPTNHRTEILAMMRSYLNDPTKVRDAAISEPALRTLDGASRYTVCLRYNARKSNGQYAGSKEAMVLFRDGRADQVLDNPRGQCKDAAYQPFRELEIMSR